jgi:WD40 repeat protein
MLATVADSGTIRLYDGYTGEVRRTLDDGRGAPRYLRFSPDGGYLALGNRDGSVRLYDVNNARYLPLREKGGTAGPATGRAGSLPAALLDGRGLATALDTSVFGSVSPYQVRGGRSKFAR